MNGDAGHAMNREVIPTDVRIMPRDALEDEIVRLRRAALENVAVFVNGDLAIHRADVTLSANERFIDIRSR